METTISDVTTFTNCRRRWDFEAATRRNLTPKEGVAALDFGGLFHNVLEIMLQGGDAEMYLLSEIESAKTTNKKMLEHLEAAPHMLDMARLWADEHLFPNYTVVETERRGFIHLNGLLPAIFFGYKFDALLEDESGNNWLLDWKTTSRRKSGGDFLLYNPQAVAYQMAAEEDMGIKIDGIIFVYIYKKVPTAPVINQNGDFSAKKVVTTERRVNERVEARGEIPSNYDSYIDSVRKSQVADYVQAFATRSNQTQRTRMRHELQTVTELMSDPDVTIYRNPGEQNCNMCPFKSPCEAEQLGVNIDKMLEMDYEQRQPRD